MGGEGHGDAGWQAGLAARPSVRLHIKPHPPHPSAHPPTQAAHQTPTNTTLPPATLPTRPPTCLVHRGRNFLHLLGAHIWAPGEPKVQQRKLAQQVLVCKPLAGGVHQVKGPPNDSLPHHHRGLALPGDVLQLLILLVVVPPQQPRAGAHRQAQAHVGHRLQGQAQGQAQAQVQGGSGQGECWGVAALIST